MQTQKKMITLILTFLIATPFISTSSMAAAKVSSANALQGVANLQLPFVQNKGQIADPTVAYVADTFACQVRVTNDGQIIYRLPEKETPSHRSPEIREQMTGITADVHGIDKQAATVNYYSGRDASKWQTRLSSYNRVGVGRTTSGIRLELKAHGQNVEKLFYVTPGTDPSAIRMTLQGAKKLRVNSEGELEVTMSSGAMRFTKPVAYQYINGTRRPVPVRYQVDRNSYGFILGNYVTSQELVIDPLVKVWYVASEVDSFGDIDAAIMNLALDAQGNVYATGYATHQLKIYKLDSRLENVLASTYIDCKGNYPSSIRSIAFDSQGNLFVAGTTIYYDFPTTDGALDDRLSWDNGDSSLFREGFVTKFSADLEMLASTLIGGDNQDEIFALAINSENKVYVAGYSTTSVSDQAHFITTAGAHDREPGPYSQKKAFIAKLSNELNEIEAATFIGGSIDDKGDKYEDIAYCLTLDKQGDVWIAGRTSQPDFPIKNGLTTGPEGEGDLFISKFKSDLSELIISTRIGGSQDEAPTDMLFDKQGDIYLLGWTFSSDLFDGLNLIEDNDAGEEKFFDTTYGGSEEDGFILKVNAKADQVIAYTYLGGEDEGMRGDDVPAAMVLSEDGSQLQVVGRTESKSFPTTPGCFRSEMDAGSPDNIRFTSRFNRDPGGDDFDLGDGFLTVLRSDLRGKLLYSTFIGTARCEYLDDIILNGDDVLVAGKTDSSQFYLAWVEEKNARGLILRFNPYETPEEPYNPGTTSDSGSDTGSGGGSGGGGGCFVATCQ